MDKIAAGIIKFQNEQFPKRKELFEKLAKGQSPRALFIACSDSRVDPSLMTQTDPGDLFVCRNAGNIVPPHTTNTGAMTASIEYAVAVLNVPHIVVCGHSGCGAMGGALHPEGLDALPHVREWIGYTRAAVLDVEENHSGLSEEEKLDLAIKRNVVLQLTHLRTHPYVASRLASGRTSLHGWVYDIGSGGTMTYDEATDEFIPLDEEYRASIAGAPNKS